MSETKLSKAIRDALKLDPDVECIRVNSGTIRKGSRFIHMAKSGTADLLLCVRVDVDDDGRWAQVKTEGRFAALEVKTPGGKTSKAREAKQGEFLQRIRDLGGFGARVASVDEAREAVARCKSGENQ